MLTDQEKQALELKQLGRTFVQIGKSLGISASRARQVFQKAKTLQRRGADEQSWADGLAPRVSRILWDAGCRNRQDVQLRIDDGNLLNIPGIGPKSADQILRWASRLETEEHSGEVREALDVPTQNGATPSPRLLECGASALTDAELIEVLAGSDASDAANGLEILTRHYGMLGLLEAKPCTLKSVGTEASTRLLAAVELARRLAKCEIPRRRLLENRLQLARYLWTQYGRRHQEVMGALFLDTHKRLIEDRVFFAGNLHRASIEPRAILVTGLEVGARAFTLFHSHPSGDVFPSAEDLGFTRRMAKAGEAVGIELVDHLIISPGGKYRSLDPEGFCRAVNA